MVLAAKTSATADQLAEDTAHTAEVLEMKTKQIAKTLAADGVSEERIKMFVAVAIFMMLAGVYWFNATNGIGTDIPTDLLVAGASLIVGYYFRGKS